MGQLGISASPPLGFWFQQGQGPAFNPMVMMIIVLVVFYLVLFMPMRRRQRAMEKMQRSLASGDEVVTTGGIVGTVVAVDEEKDLATIRVKPDGVKLQLNRTAITGYVNEADAKDKESNAKKKS